MGKQSPLNLNKTEYRVHTKKQLLFSWLLLLLCTLISVVIGEFSFDKNLMIPAALFMVFLKGQQISDIFMELKNAPKNWRFLLLYYVFILPAVIAAIYLF